MFFFQEEEKSQEKEAADGGVLPLDHEDAKKWFYRDPQGDLQGKSSLVHVN